MKLMLKVLLVASALTFAAVSFAAEGQLFSVGSHGSILRKADGKDWQVVYQTKPIRDLYCISLSLPQTGLECLAVGDQGIILYNPTVNATALVEQKSISQDISDFTKLNFKSISYQPESKLFVVVGSEAQKPIILYSTNRKNWSSANLSYQPHTGDLGLNQVQWSDGLKVFIAVGHNGLILTSGDGIDWVQQISPIPANLLHVTASNQEIYIAPDLADGALQYVLFSKDGKIWQQNDIVGDRAHTVGVSYDNMKRRFILANSEQQFFEKSEGSTEWKLMRDLPPLPNQKPLTAFNLVYSEYQVGQADGSIYRLDNETPSWQVTRAEDNSPITKFLSTYLGNFYFTKLGSYGHVQNGSSTTNALNSMAYYNGSYIAVGDGSLIIRSTDGIHWQPELEQVAPVDPSLGIVGINLLSIIYSNNSFYVMGVMYLNMEDGYQTVLLKWQANQNEWNVIQRWPGKAATKMVLHAGKFYILCNYATLYTANDPSGNWEKIQILDEAGSNDIINSISFNDRGQVVITMESGHVFNSADDGKSWSKQYPFEGTSDVIWNPALDKGNFVAVGLLGTVKLSPDGVRWKSITSSLHDYLRNPLYIPVVDGGYMYVNTLNIGSGARAIFSSKNGEHWDKVELPTTFGQRQQFYVDR